MKGSDARGNSAPAREGFIRASSRINSSNATMANEVAESDTA